MSRPAPRLSVRTRLRPRVPPTRDARVQTSGRPPNLAGISRPGGCATRLQCALARRAMLRTRTRAGASHASTRATWCQWISTLSSSERRGPWRDSTLRQRPSTRLRGRREGTLTWLRTRLARAISRPLRTGGLRPCGVGSGALKSVIGETGTCARLRRPPSPPSPRLPHRSGLPWWRPPRPRRRPWCAPSARAASSWARARLPPRSARASSGTHPMRGPHCSTCSSEDWMLPGVQRTRAPSAGKSHASGLLVLTRRGAPRASCTRSMTRAYTARAGAEASTCRRLGLGGPMAPSLICSARTAQMMHSPLKWRWRQPVMSIVLLRLISDQTLRASRNACAAPWRDRRRRVRAPAWIWNFGWTNDAILDLLSTTYGADRDMLAAEISNQKWRPPTVRRNARGACHRVRTDNGVGTRLQIELSETTYIHL
mmetsp:Transcript_21525/g.67260  ORF Transcript_21525/g.67260 Transcript_21525/m.67260 type:complete len:427 (-) Transcript_21525:49-1329(-)